MNYLAHIAEDGREQTAAEHLRGTAALAKRFAAGFGAEADAELAGLLHDIGKCTPEFQARLHGGAIVDHSTAGAKLAFSRRNLPAALAIAGHHGGIPDVGNPKADGPDEASLFGRMQRPVSFDQSALPPLSGPAPAPWLSSDWVQNAFYTRMLFSCLVDADFQDTQNFMEGAPAPRGGSAAISELLDKVRSRAATYLACKRESAIGRQRNSVLRACIDGGRTLPQGLYTLTVPTGGGKTFSSLAFALEQAAAQKMDRVIYVIPYTSIID